VILYVGGKMVIRSKSNNETALFLLPTLLYFHRLIAPAKSFTTAYYNISKGLASAERVNKILKAEVTIIRYRKSQIAK